MTSRPFTFAVVIQQQNVSLPGRSLQTATHPGAIPGSRSFKCRSARAEFFILHFKKAERQHAAESPKLSLLRAARRQPANFH
jgi:hypothetical protein